MEGSWDWSELSSTTRLNALFADKVKNRTAAGHRNIHLLVASRTSEHLHCCSRGTLQWRCNHEKRRESSNQTHIEAWRKGSSQRGSKKPLTTDSSSLMEPTGNCKRHRSWACGTKQR